MSTPSIGLRERNRLRTRDEILVAMSTMLGEQPFESITVEEVARRAGVSRGTIYSYFPDGREQLLRDAYLRIADRVAETGTAARERSSDPIERIAALAESFAKIVATPEGRFYGLSGPGIGPLSGVTGTASGRFLEMLIEDLGSAESRPEPASPFAVRPTAILLSGALREIGRVAAEDASQVGELLAALRGAVAAILCAD